MRKKQLIILTFLAAAAIAYQSCKPTPYEQGKDLYDYYCANCHQADGTSLQQLIPPLAQSDYLKKHRSEIPCLIYYGIKGEIVVNGITYNQVMPGFEQFNDIDIANLVNYINNSFGNNLGYTPLRDIQKMLNNCEQNSKMYRLQGGSR